jgi:BirA family biotin operon repressor/biotin-[acetyl-CoA-carboxylase] ligase
MERNTSFSASDWSTGFVSTGYVKLMNDAPFDTRLIQQDLDSNTLSCLSDLTALTQVDSTNSAVLRLPQEQQHAHAVVADQQTGGRGRRQRAWHSPPGGNIYLSLGWLFDPPQFALSTLPLVVAIAVCRALARAGLNGHGIKWPNDILSGNKKLAGILVEMQSAGAGPALAVMGIGLNVRMPSSSEEQLAAAIDRPWTDLDTEMGNEKDRVDRNHLVALLLNELLTMLEHYEAGGFEVLRPAWSELDLLQGKQVRLEHSGEQLAGLARGVDQSGGLLLETDTQGVQVFHSGEARIHRE